MELSMENINETKLERAKKRVEQIKGFYIHFGIYILINCFILINIYLNTYNFWQWQYFITLFAWGIGVVFHAAKVFGFRLLFSKNWEEKQIQKYLDKDREQTDKYL